LLYRSIAYPITEEPLMIGSESDSEPDNRAITIDAAGVAPQHCTVVKQGNDAILENLSNQGTVVDETPISGRAVLKLGQTIRVGKPGVKLQLIQCIQDRGLRTHKLRNSGI
jgi:pSer/pThr/pTyr-binding forkhead associated (FHA) protein